MRDLTLGRFFAAQQQRVNARLRRPARARDRTVVLTSDNILSLERKWLDDMPDNYISRKELAIATDFEYRR